MSIFESKEFWSVTVSKNKNEEFDGNSITIGNLDNNSNNINHICISSFSGFLRIYEPHFMNNSPNLLLYEYFYEGPILQVLIGNYEVNSPTNLLAILQNKRLFIIKFENLHSNISTKVMYDHSLKRNGHNFCKGVVGGRNYEIIFVQSIDGAVSIYDQDNLVNIVTLSEVYFPGQLSYLSTKDCLIISNTAYEIECYNFNNLANLKKSNNQNSINQFNHLWKVNLGELSTQIQIIYNKINKKEEIVILSETLLNLINENGQLTYQKKLDFEPMCFYAYNITDPKYQPNQIFDLMCLISSTYQHILVYKGFELSWVTKVFDTPVFLSLNNFDRIESLIVTLSDIGNLNVLYLSMEKIKNIHIADSKDIDLKKMIKETEKLNQIINNYEKGEMINNNENILNIDADVSTKIEYLESSGDNKIFYKDSYGKIIQSAVRLNFSFDGQEASNINVNIITPYNIICDDPIFTITSLGTVSTQNISKIIKFRVIEDYFPTFNLIDVYATYYIKEKNDKIFQSVSLRFELPLSLFIRVDKETKKTKCDNKITLCTNKPALKINDIFSDLKENFIDSEEIKLKANSATFMYPNKSDVTVIVSNSAGRYRIQSEKMEAILFITEQIIMRIKKKFDEVDYFIEDKINYQEYVGIIKKHFEFTENKKRLKDELEKYTVLYTALQKSLLNKYQQKTPPKINNLDFLLKQVSKNISNQSDLIEKAQNNIQLTYREIYIWTEVLLYLIKLRTKLSDKEYEILRNAFPLDSINSNDNCWEEVTLANMSNLIFYYFKNAPSKMVEIKRVEDLEKWVKYFGTLLKEIIENNGLFPKKNN